MTLILNNDDVNSVLTMEVIMKALEEAYRELARCEAVCRPRIDVQIPIFAVAGKAYELAKNKGLGKEIPTEWLLQDIRD